MEENLIEKLFNFKEEKFLLYGKNGGTLGILKLSLQILDEKKIIWFEFNFESFKVFKTPLKTRFLIPIVLTEDIDGEFTDQEDILSEIIEEIKFELGALIIGAPKYMEQTQILDKARVYISHFHQK